MARSRIRQENIQLQDDNGAVKWSFVRGEQGEYAVTLSFVDDLMNYEFEAAVIEGNNTGNGRVPRDARENGATIKLPVRNPSHDAALLSATGTSYSTGSLVYTVTGGSRTYYRALNAVTAGDAASPIVPATDSTNWQSFVNNTLYIQFPRDLIDGRDTAVTPPLGQNITDISTPSTTWSAWNANDTTIKPDRPVYGFFGLEARISGDSNAFANVFKPLRGTVEILYSPTYRVT